MKKVKSITKEIYGKGTLTGTLYATEYSHNKIECAFYTFKVAAKLNNGATRTAILTGREEEVLNPENVCKALNIA